MVTYEVSVCVWVCLQVAARKLKPQVERPPSLHERILEEIKSERKLRPVSPDQIRRSNLGETANTHVHTNILGGVSYPVLLYCTIHFWSAFTFLRIRDGLYY